MKKLTIILIVSLSLNSFSHNCGQKFLDMVGSFKSKWIGSKIYLPSAYLCDFKYQGAIGSCTSNAFAGFLESSLKSKGLLSEDESISEDYFTAISIIQNFYTLVNKSKIKADDFNRIMNTHLWNSFDLLKIFGFSTKFQFPTHFRKNDVKKMIQEFEDLFMKIEKRRSINNAININTFEVTELHTLFNRYFKGILSNENIFQIGRKYQFVGEKNIKKVSDIQILIEHTQTTNSSKPLFIPKERIYKANGKRFETREIRKFQNQRRRLANSDEIKNIEKIIVKSLKNKVPVFLSLDSHIIKSSFIPGKSYHSVYIIGVEFKAGTIQKVVLQNSWLKKQKLTLSFQDILKSEYLTVGVLLNSDSKNIFGELL